MLSACKPTQACKKIYRSGHSVDFGDNEATSYSAAQDSGYPPLRETSEPRLAVNKALQSTVPSQTEASQAPYREKAVAPKGCLATCVKPCLGGDHHFSAEDTISYSPYKEPAGYLDEDPGYALLEADDSDEEFEKKTRNFVRQFSEVNKTIDNLRVAVGALLLLASVLTATLTWMAYEQMAPQRREEVMHMVELASIPIVACLFTWFHIWMAIQMMFLPLNFFGLWQFADTGMGVGWQGVVPRKAAKMARTGYACARNYLIGPREMLNSVNPKSLVAKTKPELVKVVAGAITKVGVEHLPWIDSTLSMSYKQKIAEQVVDRIIETSPLLWNEITDILSDKQTGIDNDGMMVKVFTENKELLNRFFLSLGEQEFRFIEHCGAVMGFVCGLVQLVAFNNLSGTSRDLFLPTTGFFLGIFSNWLAIQMVFKPNEAVPVKLCGVHIYDIQGLFLKRQDEVCVLYSKMVVDNFLSFDKVVEYLMTQDALWTKLKTAYLEHNTRVMKDTLGVVATWLVPLALGQDQFERLEAEMKLALVEKLYEAKEIHKIAGRHIAKVTQLEKKNCIALQGMPKDKFEGLLHPVFQEDEWILVLLGGVLGAIVGFSQIYFLS